MTLLSPVNEEIIETAMVQAERDSAEDGWATYMHLIENIRSTWPEEQSTQDLLDEIRGKVYGFPAETLTRLSEPLNSSGRAS